MATIDASRLKSLLLSSDELALVDVREQGVYSQAHLFFAVCVPLSHLEIRMPRLAPRQSVPMVVCDGGESNNALAREAAACLQSMGYTQVQVLAGGPEQWRSAALEVYSGVNVPSKAFGEFVEHWNDTPRMPADEVQSMRDSGADMVILDSRPMDEFHRMSIPGGVDCPGAELVYRVHEMAPDPATTIVVNCAGRTRSIIGAQSLINAGIPNKVVALKDGTMGWELAGLEVVRGCLDHAPVPSPQALALASSRTSRIAERYGIRTVSESEVNTWLADDSRTTMLLDVRTEKEYVAGHFQGAWHAPGGQLVQATDEYVATRNARIVLCDGADGVRATMTGHWLVQLGWPEVFVLAGVPAGASTGHPDVVVDGLQVADTVSVADLKTRLASANPPMLIDLASSLRYRAGHIDGAL
ncbi:MAG: rhodanese-like domain-containing protein, partial [Burkholderiaceae bacterium]